MYSINKTLLQGHVGQEPELKKLEGGRSALTVSLATNEYWKDKTTGERKERTDWHRVVFYGRLAEVVAEHVRQGDVLYIEGRNQTRKYTKENNETAYVAEVIADKFKMWSKNQKGGEGANEQVPTMEGTSDSDDVPF